MYIFFYSIVNFMDQVVNEANNDITIFCVERSSMMINEKQCMLVKMNKMYCLVIFSKILVKKHYNECNSN